MMDIIEWPNDINSKKSIFLTGMPFWGPHVKILKNTKSILVRREKHVTERLWLKYTNDIPSFDTRLKIYEVASDLLKWPNNYFIPYDRAGIVFGFIPGLETEPEDILEDICKICSISVSENIWSLFDSICDDDNLYFFFKRLKLMQK